MRLLKYMLKTDPANVRSTKVPGDGWLRSHEFTQLKAAIAEHYKVSEETVIIADCKQL